MLGPHVIGSVSPHLEVIRRWKPRALLLLDPSNGAAAAVKQASPNTFLIGRVYRPDGEISDRIQADPAGAGRWAADIVAPIAAGNRDVSVWQVANEVVQTSTALIQKLNAFSISYIDKLSTYGLKAAIGGFSVGNPRTPLEDPSQWAAFHPAMRHAKAKGGVLLLHAYGAPKIFDSDDSWYLHRYEKRVLSHLPADLQQLEYVYGEYGCDMGIIPGHTLEGWKVGYQGNWDAYANDLWRAAEFLAGEPYCKGACVFTLGQFGDWHSFDIAGDCANKLASMYWPAPVVEPEPGGDMDLPELLLAKGEENRDTRFNPRAALQQAINGDGFQIASDEFDVSHDGAAYKAQLAERLSDGMVRVYYGDMRGGQWAGNVRFVQRGGGSSPEHTITWHASPNYNNRPTGARVQAIVWHATAGGLASTLDHLDSASSKAGTHYVIDRDGSIYQMVADEKRAWHAGETILVGGYDYNDFSLGIELVNLNNGTDPYPQAQLDAAVWLGKLLKSRHAIPKSGNVSHAAVAVPPGRKSDPKGLDLNALINRIYS